MFSHLKLSLFLVHRSLVLLIFWKNLMALRNARICFDLNEKKTTEPLYPVHPNRKGLI